VSGNASHAVQLQGKACIGGNLTRFNDQPPLPSTPMSPYHPRRIRSRSVLATGVPRIIAEDDLQVEAARSSERAYVPIAPISQRIAAFIFLVMGSGNEDALAIGDMEG